MRLRTIKSTGNVREKAVEKLKIIKRLKKRAWNTPQIKTKKESAELGRIRPQTQHKEREKSNLKFLPPSVENIANCHGY